jgi:putative ABC transport system permease protein
LKIVATTSAVVGVVGSIIGLVAGAVTTAALFGTQLFAASNWRLWGSAVLWCLLAGLLISGLSSILPARRMLRREITGEQHVAQRARSKPLWARMYLDVAALVAAVVVYKITQVNGFHPVLNAEGNPTLSLSFYTLLAPMLFWIGAVLVLVRLGAALLRRYTSKLGWLLRGLFGEVGSYAALMSSRRAQAMSKAAVIVALALSFGFSVALFSSTYTHQQEVDARLTLGADVRVATSTAHPQTTAFTSRLDTVPGAADATPFKTTVAYVGSEIEDIFGVNVAGMQKVTTFSDTFFRPYSAQATLAKLASTPDGILISDEMANLYSIVPGNHVKISLFDRRTGSYRVSQFTVVGVALEFATAPKDAFLVVNLPALIKATNDPTVNNFLVRATGDPATVARQIRTSLAADRVQTDSIASVRSSLATSLTSLNLSGLVRIEYIYTALIASAGLTVFLLALLADRRREFASMRALGATGRQLMAFVLSEGGLIGVTGLLVGTVIGVVQAIMLVQILTSIFDPPPSGPIPDYGILLLLAALSIVGMTVATSIGVGRLSTSRVSDALRER